VGDIVENPRKFEYFINKYMKTVEVSCGNSHIAVVAVNKDGSHNENGFVFTWGLDLFGRLGYMSDNKRGHVAGDEGIKLITIKRSISISRTQPK
jgi:alpha-tubulin suppressor-like RCC1 family protein